MDNNEKKKTTKTNTNKTGAKKNNNVKTTGNKKTASTKNNASKKSTSAKKTTTNTTKKVVQNKGTNVKKTSSTKTVNTKKTTSTKSNTNKKSTSTKSTLKKQTPVKNTGAKKTTTKKQTPKKTAVKPKVEKKVEVNNAVDLPINSAVDLLEDTESFTDILNNEIIEEKTSDDELEKTMVNEIPSEIFKDEIDAIEAKSSNYENGYKDIQTEEEKTKTIDVEKIENIINKATKVEDSKFKKNKNKNILLALGIIISIIGIVALFVALIANRIVDRDFLSDTAITLMIVGSIIIEGFGAFIIVSES